MESLKQKVSNILGGKSKGPKKAYRHLPSHAHVAPNSKDDCRSVEIEHSDGDEEDGRDVAVDVQSAGGSLRRKLKTFRSLDDLFNDVRSVIRPRKNSYSHLPTDLIDSDCVGGCKDGGCVGGCKDGDCVGGCKDGGCVGRNGRGQCQCASQMEMNLNPSTGCEKMFLVEPSSDGVGDRPNDERSPGCGSTSSCSSDDGDARLASPGSSEKCLPVHHDVVGVLGQANVTRPGDEDGTGTNGLGPRGSDTGRVSTRLDTACNDQSDTNTKHMTKELDNVHFKVPMMQKSHSTRRLSLSGSFELPRFRKRKHNGSNKENDDDDNISVQSLDVSGTSAKKKSKKSLLRVSASLANLISPSRNKNDGEGFKVPSSPLRQTTTSPYRPPQPSPAKRPVQLTWQDSFGMGHRCNQTLSQADIKRQEAIYELYQGEKAMMEDLINVTKLYRDSLVTLGLVSSQDVNTLFGNIDSLIPVHKDLIQRLQEERRADGTTHNIGSHVLEWTESLTCYVDYCANQIQAKAIFDQIKNQSAVDDFLQRCLASPFSRKLDLWTLLDGAKARFIKYPLLIRSIIKYSASDCEDAFLLEKAVKRLEEIIREADHQTGLAKCNHSKSSLVYLFDDQRVPEIDSSTSLVCSGCMKNTKGSKLYVFVYDKVVLASRSTTQNGRQLYQVYRQPIPVSDLVVEDLPDGEVKLGSFRNAFGQGGQTGKNLIRISFRDTEKGQSHTLIANDEHDKRQWVQSFQKITNVLLHTSTSSTLSSSLSSSSSSDNKSKDKSSHS